MIQFCKLNDKDQKKLSEKVIDLKQKGWNFEDVAFHSDISIHSAFNIIKKAKAKGVKFPEIRSNGQAKLKARMVEVKQIDKTPETKPVTIQPRKFIKTVKITAHFSTAKDFWLFNN